MGIPMRSCRICRQTLPKSQLTRWVWQDGQLVRDTAQRLSGRGIYSCSQQCTDRIIKAGPKIRK